MRFTPHRSMMRRSGVAGITDTVKTHPLLTALAVSAAVAGVFAYRKSHRRRRR